MRKKIGYVLLLCNLTKNLEFPFLVIILRFLIIRSGFDLFDCIWTCLWCRYGHW